jgi:hypothetical protein
VAVNDALHGRETDTGSGKLVDRVKSLEGSEQLVGESHVESGTVVAHEEGSSSFKIVSAARAENLGIDQSEMITSHDLSFSAARMAAPFIAVSLENAVVSDSRCQPLWVIAQFSGTPQPV